MSQNLRILVPTDGSPAAERALRHVLGMAQRGLAVELHLLNVQPPVRGVAASVISQADLTDYHRDEGMKVLAEPVRIAEAGGITPHVHIGVGEPGEIALAFAKRLGAEQIVMGTRGFGSVAGLLLGSAARTVVGEGDVPVTLLR
jgi:nucleotide-binding universal stress UspA family protein